MFSSTKINSTPYHGKRGTMFGYFCDSHFLNFCLMHNIGLKCRNVNVEIFVWKCRCKHNSD